MTVLVWYREKDLRVTDHAPLAEAGLDAVPVFAGPAQGHLEAVLGDLAARLGALGSGLVRLPEPALQALPALARRLGAEAVHAHAFSEPGARDLEARMAEALTCRLRLFSGERLTERVRTREGGMYRVFTAFYQAFQREALLERPRPEPSRLAPLPPGLPAQPPGPRLPDLLAPFLETGLAGYAEARDRLDREGTSGLSVDLHVGRISVATCWAAASGRPGAGPWQRQLVWREFALHLLREWPELLREPFQAGFRGFPWRDDPEAFRAWTEGRTGYPVVDAAARQLRETGRVHNRARMIAASFLAKHLLLDWRLGEAHYLAHLLDADAANNSMGWQWSAGCGCDAQPWFRVFNPVLQGEKFDPQGDYVRRWVPELREVPARRIHRPWEGDPPRGYPPPIVDHAAARARFLAVAKAHLRP